MSLPFLNKLTVVLKNIPSYPLFGGDFIEPVDSYLLQLIHDSDNENLTPPMKSSLKTSILNNIKGQKLIVKHHQTHGLGRFYGDEKITLIPHSKYIKHTLFKYMGWLDIDMVKGHPSIAIEMGKLNGFYANTIQHYINHFDSVCESIINFYQDEDKLTKDDIKYLFCMMLYGGGFNRWVKELEKGDEVNGYKPKVIKNADIIYPFIQLFKDECAMIKKKVYSSNPALVKKLKRDDEEKWATENRVISYWFQIIENHILYIVYEFLLKENIIKKSVCGLEYDGLCIPPIADDFDKDDVINRVNALILAETGLTIKMKFKDYDPNYVLHCIIEQRKALVIAEPIDTVEAVEVECSSYFATDFETTHAKIVEKGCYIKQRENDILIMSPKALNDAYSHLIGGYSDKGVPENFIKKWTINNPYIKKYTNMDIFPDKTKCPVDWFNLWIPFTFEKQIDGFVYNPECKKMAFILNHIKILCNHQQDAYEYILKYIAQMIQFPAVKSIVPTFISKQGAGKGTLLKLFARMLGDDKVCETSTPSRDVWGNFNSMMVNSFLVNLNELSKKDTKDAEGVIKTLCTDPTIVINQKGVSQFKIKSYHRFIITTNKEDPIKTTADDRRNIILRSSDEKCSNKSYFEEINKYLDDDLVIKNMYEYFKQIPDMDKFGLLPIPRTIYQDNLKESNRCIIDLWVEGFTMRFSTEKGLSYDSYQVYEDFNLWKTGNGIQYDINNISFGCKLSNLNINGLTHNTTTRRWGFDIPTLKKHFKM